MNGTAVPSTDEAGPDGVLAALAGTLDALPPEQSRAAAHLIDHPRDIGVCTVRELAEAAGVKPNTLVRLARAAGFEGFEDMRRPFREALRQGAGANGFPDRARWLQALSRGGRHDELFAEMAGTAIGHMETVFGGTDAAKVRAAADAIRQARRCFVLGVGIAHGPARNFAYLASMVRDGVEAIPREGGPPIDDLIRAEPGDALVAMTYRPYRRAVVDAVAYAAERGVTVIGISDSAASPIVAGARHGFVTPVDTPQFFTSTFATQALLDTIMAFVVAGLGDAAVERIEALNAHRHATRTYRDEPADTATRESGE